MRSDLVDQIMIYSADTGSKALSSAAIVFMLPHQAARLRAAWRHIDQFGFLHGRMVLPDNPSFLSLAFPSWKEKVPNPLGGS